LGNWELPIDYFNCAAHADLAVEEADPEITASIERMRAHAVPGSWHVGPSMRPPDLGAHLLAHGFEYGGDDIGMAVDLDALPEEVAVPGSFVVERVGDEARLAEWVATFGTGFGLGPAEVGRREISASPSAFSVPHSAFHRRCAGTR